MRLQSFYTALNPRKSIDINLDAVTAVECVHEGRAPECLIFTPGHCHHVLARASEVTDLLTRKG